MKLQKINFINEISFFLFFYLTPLYIAVNNQNPRVVRLLLEDPKIDVNLKAIWKQFFFNQIPKQFFF